MGAACSWRQLLVRSSQRCHFWSLPANNTMLTSTDDLPKGSSPDMYCMPR